MIVTYFVHKPGLIHLQVLCSDATLDGGKVINAQFACSLLFNSSECLDRTKCRKDRASDIILVWGRQIFCGRRLLILTDPQAMESVMSIYLRMSTSSLSRLLGRNYEDITYHKHRRGTQVPRSRRSVHKWMFDGTTSTHQIFNLRNNHLHLVLAKEVKRNRVIERMWRATMFSELLSRYGNAFQKWWNSMTVELDQWDESSLSFNCNRERELRSLEHRSTTQSCL